MNIFTIGSASYLLFDLNKDKNIVNTGYIIKENILTIMNKECGNKEEKLISNKGYKEIIKSAYKSDYILIDLIDEIYEKVIINNINYTYSYNLQNDDIKKRY